MSTALFAAYLWRTMAKSPALQRAYFSDRREEMLGAAKEFEDLACGVLTQCDAQNHGWARDLLHARSADLVSPPKSCLQV